MKTVTTEAIIIKRTNYGEADRVITVFTRFFGKLRVKAPGVRRIPSRRSAHVELLNHSLISLYRGSNLPILTEARTINDHYLIKSNLEKIGRAFHLCEIIDGLCPENQENETVFDLLKNMLVKLTSDLSIDIRGFEMDLLGNLGYLGTSSNTRQNLNSFLYIENILERRLKTQRVFSRLLQQ